MEPLTPEQEEEKRRATAAPPAAIAAPAIPVVSHMGQPVDTTTQSSGGSNSTVKISEEAKLADGVRIAALAKEGAAKKRELELEANGIAKENEALEAERVETERHNVERAAVRQQQDAARQTELARVAALEEQHSKSELKGLFRDSSTGDKVLAGLAIALGAFRSNGGENRAMKILDSAIAQDLEKQKYAIEHRAKYIEKHRGGIAAADAYRTSALEDLDAKHVGILKGISLKARQTANTSKSEVVRQKGEALGLSFDTKAAEKSAELAEKTNINVQRNFGNSTTVGIKAGGAGAGTGTPDKLDLLDENGAVIGQAYTEKEAIEARNARTALGKAATMAEDLKSKLDRKLLPIWDSDKEDERATIISQLVEVRKEVTGAETAGDAQKYLKQLTTAWNKGPEAAKESVDQFLRGTQVGYRERVKSIAAGGTKPAADAGQPAAPKVAQPTPTKITGKDGKTYYRVPQ